MFKIGDRVKVKAKIYNDVGRIIKIEPTNKPEMPLYHVMFDYSGFVWVYWRREIEIFDPKTEIERNRKKDEMYIKMIDIDPYGEENWYV